MCMRYQRPVSNEKELCVICGGDTPYTKDVHIQSRNYYIEGAGQLCRRCYNDVAFPLEHKRCWRID